ncbi:MULTISPECIES: uridine kinase [Nonlabens]|uniref:Uridine kinase n=3 Tax=Nonlabens TaxID=363408 RepID=A0A081DFY7_NONUL|nr:uridine kinase [Nonlabens ulvanivorans]EAS19687.1 uridine kinase [Flavobacteria bacterium BBFL7]MBF4985132.1 uridine kinase [Nonlabens mediterrranea]KEZ94502.1 uridine kinase [Nonlabens ulvanivorans]PRX13462.1 uridine kinase [Nonlabens ulvanivorans]WOI23722.1 uridine kinase [Nonlabens ulvanivorans]
MLILGIAGGTGSGKTTVVDQMVHTYPDHEVNVISQDSYYKDTSHLSYEERVKINFDHPGSIDFELLEKHLLELKEGKTIDQPVYSFVEHNRTGEVVKTAPSKVVIVEGILILTQPRIRDLFDIKVYIDCDSDERLIRRLKRDIADRGRDLTEVLERYQNTLKPMHQQFIEPTKAYADVIIPTNRFNTVGVQILRGIIDQRLAEFS